MGSITLLFADGPQAKRLTPEGVQPSQQYEWFEGFEAHVNSASELFGLLEQAQHDPRVCAVRGAILPHVTKARMRRRHRTDATLGEVAQPWILIDVDSWKPEIDGKDFASDPMRCLLELVQALPPELQQASCWWQVTGSAGFKPGVRLRLAYWLDRALTNAECKRWVSSWAVPVDKSLYTPSQPHYLARPVVEPGAVDPVRVRSGISNGTDIEVHVPDLNALEVNSASASKADQALKRASSALRKAEDGTKHNSLNKLAFELSHRWSEDELPAERIEGELLAALAKSGTTIGHDAQRTAKDAIAAGRQKQQARRAGWRAQLAEGDDGNPRSTLANVSLFLEHHDTWATCLAYDERAQLPMWVEPPPWGGEVPRPVVAPDHVRVAEWFQTHCWIDAKLQWIAAGLDKAARRVTYDVVQDYLSTLPEWDGTARADSFFVRHLGVPDTRLVRAQTAAWLLQAYRRAWATLQEPVQADYLIVLTGRQGLRKSSLCRALCPHPRFFREQLPDLRDKDALRAVADSWIVELAELTHRKADRDVFKAFLSARVDKFRAPYARDEVSVPRRCALIGTVNEDEFLSDPTGNRRFWPFVCTARADIDAVVEERDQLWAEIKLRAERGEQAYLPDDLELEAEDVQEQHREEDAAEDALAVALRSPVGGPLSPVQLPAEQLDGSKCVRAIQARQACQLIGLDPMKQQNLQRVKMSMKRLRWYEVRRMVQGVTVRLWTPPEGWRVKTQEQELVLS